jgi:hypothetical protein
MLDVMGLMTRFSG